ncbi:hypothetical protein [Echinicola sp. 20G]|uniref:hypothetical protein n=1 Tax=Echinicola sp. 20G TaxID=2781961 RepID=UPI001910BD09|nr:hypothetical protein [Echinicola sp. 20G]
MKQLAKLFTGLTILVLGAGCSQLTESIYTDNVQEYELNTIDTEYGYTGKAVFKEFADGSGLELTITLEGEASKNEYYFPAHLHYGQYQQGENSPMAEMLNPVDIRPLKSVTIIKGFSLEDLNYTYYHIKVHLAEEGPDYEKILVAGNVGEYNENADSAE